MGGERHKHDNKDKGWSNPHVRISFVCRTTERQYDMHAMRIAHTDKDIGP